MPKTGKGIMGSSNTGISQKFEKMASTRSFIGGTGLALAVFLTGIRIFILRKELADSGVLDGLALVTVSSRQDWAVVLLIMVIAFAFGVGRGEARGITKGVVGLLFLSLILLFWGIANVISVQILHYLTPASVLIVFLAVTSFAATAIIFSALLDAVFNIGRRRQIMVASLVVVFLPFTIGHDRTQISDGKLSNLVLAFGHPVFAEGQNGPQFADLNGKFEGLAELPIERAIPVPRPEFEPGQIKNVIVIALESTSAKYADGFGGTFGLTPYLTEYSAMGHQRPEPKLLLHR